MVTRTRGSPIAAGRYRFLSPFDLRHWGPRAEEVAWFGPARARSLAGLRLANVVLFSVAVAFALVNWVSPPNLLNPPLTSWPVGERHLTVVDKTGDPAWHQVISQAAQSWDGAGAGIHLVATTGTGPCRADGTRIELCQVPFAVLARSDVPDIQGITKPVVDDHHHIGGVVINVCSDCDLSPDRRLVIATHEVGHALGLVHTLDPTSVMFPVGGSNHPSSADDLTLRQRYPPAAG